MRPRATEMQPQRRRGAEAAAEKKSDRSFVFSSDLCAVCVSAVAFFSAGACESRNQGSSARFRIAPAGAVDGSSKRRQPRGLNVSELLTPSRGKHMKKIGRTARVSYLLASLALCLSSAAVSSAFAQVGTPAQAIQTLTDFKVERLISADKAKHGSWINLGKDNKGRLLLGGQNRQPVTRVTIRDGKIAKEEVLKLPVSETMGILWAFDSLYLNGSRNGRFGLFRLRDKDGDDQFESVERLGEWKGGGGEHGAHGIVLGPDNKLYTVCGNFVEMPPDILPSSPHRNYQDDLPLPRAEDGNGFGAGKRPPGGFVMRMDADGKNAELFASGQRNTYDIAVNADGEIFGFDSDMEWDWGMPWYRPIRVFQAVSGGDTGFREGTAKWPPYYFDSLPASVDVGIGSPTGVVFGYGAKFPA